MSKKMLLRDIRKCFSKSKGRFISIMFLIMLGSFALVGLNVSGPDMRSTSKHYFDSLNIADITVIGDYGIDEENKSVINQVTGAESIEYGYLKDVVITDTKTTFRLFSKPSEVSLYEVVEGRLPEVENEIAISSLYQEEYAIGDTIKFTEKADDTGKTVLKYEEFKIVGFINSGEIIARNMGQSTAGTGELKGYAVVDSKAFDSEIYMIARIKFEDTKGVDPYSKEYTQLIQKHKEDLDELLKDQPGQRLTAIKEEYQSEIDEGKNEIENAKQKIEDTKQQLDDAAKKLADANQEVKDSQEMLDTKVAEAQEKINTGETKISNASDSISQAEQQLAKGKEQIESSQSILDEKLSQLQEAKNQLDQAKATLQQAETELKKGKQAIEDGWEQYKEGNSQLVANEEKIQKAEDELKKKEEELTLAKLALEQKKQEINDQLTQEEKEYLEAQIAAMEKEISKNEAELTVAKQQFAVKKQQIVEAKQSLAESKEILEQKEAEYEAARLQYDKGIKTYKENLEKYNANLTLWEESSKTLSEKKAEYEKSLFTLKQAKKELKTKQEELEQAKKELASQKSDGEQKIEEAKKEISSKEAEYTSKLEEFQEKKADAEKEIAENEAKLKDAQEAVDNLEQPVYALDTRREIPGSEGYRLYHSVSTIIDSLSRIFPIFMYLVAALVTLTTMTRFVDEERTNSGTLKALGYGNWDIIKKFTLYGFVASTIGAILGIIAGHTVLPLIVYNAYADGFTLPRIELNFYPGITIIALVLAFLSAVLPAYIVASKELIEKPAALLLPKPPAAGSKIFLERMKPIWNRMTFTQKVTARNIFRYKKRMLMTIFGVCGSVTLLFTGLSVQHSIAGINERQFGEIINYDLIVARKNNVNDQQTKEIKKLLESDDVKQQLPVYYEDMSKLAGDNNDRQDIIMIVPEDSEELKNYISLVNRKSGETLALQEDGVIISERLAKLLEVGEGDTIVVTDSGNQKREMRVSAITEMYMGHFMFMDKAYYKTVFGEDYTSNANLVTLKDNSSENANAYANEFMQLDGVKGLVQNTAKMDQIDTIVESLNKIMDVLIGVAVLLAVVILYNLTNINVSERIRELSTIKVLGFLDKEVTLYIYRETMILSFLGILVGFLMGDFLYLYIITAVPPDDVMFNPSLGWAGFILPTIIVTIITVILGLIMNRRLKNVNMLEALKSVE